MKKRVLSILLSVVMLWGALIVDFPIEVNSSSILPNDIYLAQETSVTCTLSSATMMLRACLYLNGESSWPNVTESVTRPIAWAEGVGLYWNFTYNIGAVSMRVSHESVSGVTVSQLKSLLDTHPEGIVLYCGTSPHAVYLTDYVGDTFYCADPAGSYSGKRIPLASSLLGARYGSQAAVLANSDAYWYISSYSVDGEVVPGKPCLKYTIDSQTVTFTWKPTANTTHYNLWIDRKNADGNWESVDQIFYAESGLSRTLEDGEYRAQLLSYNSNAWESDGSDWVHTWADDVYFTINNEKWITIYDAKGKGFVWNTYGTTFTLPTSYSTCEGSYFSGWSYEQGAEFYDVRPGETIEVTEDISLYPVYVTHEQAVSGNLVLIYNIEDFPKNGYNIQAVDTTLNRLVNTSYWTDWSDFSTTEVTASDTVEVRTETLYRYYYFLCPSCGAHEPFYGTSDCGATIPSDAWHVDWFTIPYTQSNYQTYNYTTSKYYTTSLGDGQIWHFSSGNLYDTAPGTVDAGGDTVVIATGYSSRDYVEQYETISEPVTAYRITEAKAGENLTWTFDGNGTLTISGTGAMTDYSGNDVPWYNLRSSIKKVVIEEGVTSIGDYAFYYCTSLTSATVPDSVTDIGEYAFCRCEGLISITIPDSVTSIGEGAFCGCESLTSITIPDSVTSIGVDVFFDCENLTSVTIPDSVTSIGRFAFAHCTRLTSVIIPNDVTAIDEYAFYNCANLSNVTYCGTAEQWGKISVGSNNDPLENATLSYHNMVDGVCTVCGATADPALDETLIIVSKDMLLGGYIGAQFEVDMDAITASGYEYAFIIVTVNGEKYVYDISLVNDRYIFEHRVAPKDMGVDMQITAYGVKNGVTYHGNTETWSIKDGIMERLAKFYPYIKYQQYKDRCVLLVDMLYYGAAAQATLNETNESLVTDGLSEEYVALKTTAEPTISAENTATSTAKDQLYQVNLGVEDAVQMQLLFRLAEEDYSKYVVKITNGENVYEYTGEDFVPEASSAKFVNLIFDKLEATNMRDVVTVELWMDGALVSSSYSLSIEGFANSYIQAGKYVDLLKAMITYGDSAIKSLGN